MASSCALSLASWDFSAKRMQASALRSYSALSATRLSFGSGRNAEDVDQFPLTSIKARAAIETGPTALPCGYWVSLTAAKANRHANAYVGNRAYSSISVDNVNLGDGDCGEDRQ
jgi:hypothetical protein